MNEYLNLVNYCMAVKITVLKSFLEGGRLRLSFEVKKFIRRLRGIDFRRIFYGFCDNYTWKRAMVRCTKMSFFHNRTLFLLQ